MANRVIKESITYSKEIDSLTWFQEVLFYRLIVKADDFGRFHADPQIVKSELFPRKEDLTKKAVVDGLKVLENNGLIKRYVWEDSEYLQITKWDKHQQRRAAKSKYPDENGNHLISIDINCNQKISGENNGNQMSPRTRTRTRYEDKRTRNENENGEVVVGDPGFISTEDAQKIQREHDEIFNKLEYAGFSLTHALMDEVVKLYEEYGKQALFDAVDVCVNASKTRLDYLRGVLRNSGRKKANPDGKRYMTDEEEEDLKTNLIW